MPKRKKKQNPDKIKIHQERLKPTLQEYECERCHEIKGIREFFTFTAERNHYGATIRIRHHMCRNCRRISYNRKWRERNKARIKQYNKLYWEHKSSYNPNRKV